MLTRWWRYADAASFPSPSTQSLEELSHEGLHCGSWVFIYLDFSRFPLMKHKGIIIAAFIMLTFPSSGCSRCNILLLLRSLDTISTPHLQFTVSPASIPCQAAYYGVTAKHILKISFASYRVLIYTPGARAAMWINCLAEGQKCWLIAWFEPRLSAWEFE